MLFVRTQISSFEVKGNDFEGTLNSLSNYREGRRDDISILLLLLVNFWALKIKDKGPNQIQ